MSRSAGVATYSRDSSTGLDYALNRYYGNTMGRFLTPDPFGGSAKLGRPNSWNRYAYVENDPVNHNDPSGLFLPGDYSPFDYSDFSHGWWYIGGNHWRMPPDSGGGGGGGGGGASAPPSRMQVENCDFPSFAGLTAQQQALIGNQSTWESLNSPKLLASFLNITGGLGAAGIDLSQLTLQDSGIHQDRLLLDANSSQLLQLRIAGNAGFTPDKPAGIFHPGMADWGFRQNVDRNSLQVGGGGGGAFIDIDPWNPLSSLPEARRGHTADVIKGFFGIKTNPLQVGSGLGEGVTNYKCK